MAQQKLLEIVASQALLASPRQPVHSAVPDLLKSLVASHLLRTWFCLTLLAGSAGLCWAQQLGVESIGWKPLGLAAAPNRIVDMVVDPRSASTIYLNSPSGGLWRSNDSGVSWSPRFDFNFAVQTCSFALDPSAPDVQYAGTGDDKSPRPAQGVARSTDGGSTWKMGVRFTNRPVCALAVDPVSSGRILAGSAEGLYLSTDSGNAWRKVYSSPITSIAFDSRGNIYAGDLSTEGTGGRSQVLLRSTNGGQNWTAVPLPVTLSSANSLTDSISILAQGGNLYVVVSYHVLQSTLTNMDFYLSTDGGATWNVSASIGASNPPVKIIADPNSDNIYVTGVNLLTTADRGNSWNTVATVFKNMHAGLLMNGYFLLAGEEALENLPLTPGVMGTQVVLPIAQFLDIALDTSGNVWAAGPGGLFGRFKSGVYGTGVGYVVAPSAGTSRNVFASANTSAFSSNDLGGNFNSATVIAPSELRAPYPPLAINTQNPAQAFIGGQRLYRTTNSGVTWAAIATIDTTASYVVTALVRSTAGGNTLYAATACLPEVANATCSGTSNIFRSQNAGATWTKMSTVLGLVSRLAGDTRQANSVYAAIGAFPGGPSQTAGYSAGDLLRSTDGGATWTSVMGNLPRVPINAVVVDPTSAPTATAPGVQPRPGGGIIFFPPGQNPLLQPAQTVWVGTDAGVFVTFNAGQQWTAVNSGLPAVPVSQLSLQQPGGTLEAATFGRGAYQLSAGGLLPRLIASPLSANITMGQGLSRSLSLSLSNVSATSLDWQLTPLEPWLNAAVIKGTIQPAGSSSLTVQISSASLGIGTYQGRIQVTTGTLTQYVLVTLQVTTPPASMNALGSTTLSGAPNASLPPLSVTVLDTTGAAIPGVEVNFSISSGGGSLSHRTAITDVTGIARTILTLPTAPGIVQVTATAGSFSVTFNATVILVIRPSLLSNSLVNGVTYSAQTLPSPGTILAIFGEHLAITSAEATVLPLPGEIEGTRVLLSSPDGDVPLPLFFVSPQQINAILPYDLSPGTYTVTVESNSVASNPVSLSLAAVSPGIFTMSPSGQGQGIFLKDNGSLVTAANPAAPGSVVTFFATGLGAVDPPIAPGAAGNSAEPLNRTTLTPLVFFDSNRGTLIYSGLAPGFAGLYQINVRIPAGTAPASNVSVSLSIGGITSNRATIPVR